jgi:hypothetical protein
LLTGPLNGAIFDGMHKLLAMYINTNAFSLSLPATCSLPPSLSTFQQPDQAVELRAEWQLPDGTHAE